MNTEYLTNRLVIKKLSATEGEAALVLDYFQRNKAHLAPWDPFRSDEFYKVESRKAAMEWEEDQWSRDAGYRLWIFKKEDIYYRKIIGTIGITNVKRGISQCCTIGYSIDSSDTGCGYITEAMSKIIDVLFNQCSLHRIEATVMPGNKPSLRVLEKLGFQREGLCRKYEKINGKWEDHVLLSLLNEQ